MIVTYDSERERYRVKIDAMVDGERLRKTKLLPRGITLDQAYRYAEHIYSGPLSFQDRLAKMVAGRPNNHGLVYFIQNPSLPGLVKIGMTRRSVHERVRHMSTGHAYPWNIICDGVMRHPDIVEIELHRHLSDYRESENREFFRMSPAAALEALAACLEVDGVDTAAAIATIGSKPR